jgi:hypothetical protein
MIMMLDQMRRCPIVQSLPTCIACISSPCELLAWFLASGGASTQFACVPLNLTGGPDDVTDYVVTGAWSKKVRRRREAQISVVPKFCGAHTAVHGIVSHWVANL